MSTNQAARALIDQLSEIIPEVMRLRHLPGLAIAVALDGEIAWEQGFGFADLHLQVPMTPRSVMRSGSMGKTYTATAVMQLVEKDVMGLHDPINRHLRAFQVRNPLGEREVTVYDLLTHRSGLATNAASSGYTRPAPLEEHLAEVFHERERIDTYHGSAGPLWSAKVGTTFQYSNHGIATLGYLVEAAKPEGLSFPDYVQRHIVEPLGMTSTQYPAVHDAEHVRPEIWERRSTGYTGFAELDLPTPAIYFADFPAGNVMTTPGDHIKVLLAYLNGGTYNGHRLLRPETVKLMLTHQTDRPGSAYGGVGLVWGLADTGKLSFHFGHGGAHMYGWQSDYRAYPELGLAMVIAINRWDMIEWYRLPARASAHELLFGLAAGRLLRRRAGTPDPPAKPWAWKRAYLAGLIMAERLGASLGISSPMPAGARTGMVSAVGTAGWEASGFEAGLQDISSAEPTLAGIRSFMSSDRLQVPAEELEVLHESLGGLGLPRLPLL